VTERSDTPRGLLQYLGARWLTPVILGGGLFALLLTLVLQASESARLTSDIEISLGGPEVTRLMATNPLVAGFFVVLWLHLLARWILGLIGDRSAPSLEAARPDRILAESWRYAIVSEPEEWQDVADEHLQARADSVRLHDRGVYRLRPTRVPLRVWQLGLLLVFAGLLASTFWRQSGTAIVGEGQVLKSGEQLPISRYEWRYPAPGAHPLDFEALRLEENSVDTGLDAAGQPRAGTLIRWPISARFAYLDGGKEHAFWAGMYPPTLVRGQLVQLSGVGLGPRLSVAYRGQPALDSFAPLDLLPGQSTHATVAIAPVPYTLDFTLLPNAGPASATRYALKLVDPASGVIASGTVGAGAGSVNYGGWSVSVVESRYWVALNVTRDPGILVMAIGVLGFLLGLAGWLLTLARGCEEYALVEEADAKGTRLLVGVDASLAARRRAARRFERLLAELSR
jgi:hypothetical protein